MIRGRTLTWLATLVVWVLVIRTRMTAADGLHGSISGRVLFATDNRPAEGVKVDLRRSSFEPVTTMFTRSNGEFEVSGLASTSYLLLVEEQGYEPVQQAVELNLSAGRGLLLYLKKADAERPHPPPLPENLLLRLHRKLPSAPPASTQEVSESENQPATRGTAHSEVQGDDRGIDRGIDRPIARPSLFAAHRRSSIRTQEFRFQTSPFSRSTRFPFTYRFAARAPCDSKGSECQCGIHTAATSP